MGEDTGTADVLSRLIIERMKLAGLEIAVKSNWKIKIHDPFPILIIGEDTNIPPLFFPCGSIKREVLPTALRDNGEHLTLLCHTIKSHSD